MLPLSLRLTEDLSLSDVINRLTWQPAKILGIDAGTLSVGEKADICIYNPNTNWIMQAEQMLSAGRNTPFEGWELKGKVEHTLLNGEVVYSIS